MAKKKSASEKTENTEDISLTVEQAESVNHAKCGGALKEERLKQGLSVGDICTQLRLSATQIEALEADHFSKLPQPSIVRGFIRNYAKALQIDAAPILAIYQQLNPEVDQQALTVKQTADSYVIGGTKSGFSPLIFIALISLFALVGGGYYYYTQYIQSNQEKTVASETPQTETVQTSNTETTTEFVLSPSIEQPSTNTPSASTQNESVAVKTTDTQANTTEIDITKPKTPVTTLTLDKKSLAVDPVLKEASESNSIDQKTEPEKPISSSHAQLEVATTAATWVNVTNYYSGKEIFSQIVPANTTKTISAKKPFKVIIGNAPQTTLSIDGEAFDLASKTRNKIAKLSVK